MRYSTAFSPRSRSSFATESPTTNSRSVRSSPRNAVVNPVATMRGGIARGGMARWVRMTGAPGPRCHVERDEPTRRDPSRAPEVAVVRCREARKRRRHHVRAEGECGAGLELDRRETRHVVVVALVEYVRRHRQLRGERMAQAE